MVVRGVQRGEKEWWLDFLNPKVAHSSRSLVTLSTPTTLHPPFTSAYSPGPSSCRMGQCRPHQAAMASQ
jgi:hypothetical protein